MKKFILFLLLIVPVMVLAQDTTGNEVPTDNSWSVSTIINLVLTAVTVFFAAKWGIVKGKFGQIAEAFATVRDAIADNNVSNEEAKLIAEKFKKVFSKG